MPADRRAGVVVALVLVGGLVSIGLGLVGAPGGVSEEEITPTGEDVEPAGPSFVFEVDGIEECGLTCRNVTATLANTGDGPARNVTVNTTLYADAEEVWNASRDVGAIGANESYMATEQVTVNLQEAQAIQENDGYVTIEVEVAFEEGAARFERRRQVV